jgi:hypothetical protein
LAGRLFPALPGTPSILTLSAFCEAQESVTVSPESMLLAEAVNVTVGFELFTPDERG